MVYHLKITSGKCFIKKYLFYFIFKYFYRRGSNGGHLIVNHGIDSLFGLVNNTSFQQGDAERKHKNIPQIFPSFTNERT